VFVFLLGFCVGKGSSADVLDEPSTAVGLSAGVGLVASKRKREGAGAAAAAAAPADGAAGKRKRDDSTEPFRRNKVRDAKVPPAPRVSRYRQFVLIMRAGQDRKYGFGGKKRYAKSNTSDTAADMEGFHPRKMKTGAKTGAKGGAKGPRSAPNASKGRAGGRTQGKRPGKQRRQQSHK
jgi:hypothetical protein